MNALEADEDVSVHIISFLDLCDAHALGASVLFWRAVLTGRAKSRMACSHLTVPTIRYQVSMSRSFHLLFDRFGLGLDTICLAAPHLKGGFRRSIDALILKSPNVKRLRLHLCETLTFAQPTTEVLEQWESDAGLDAGRKLETFCIEGAENLRPAALNLIIERAGVSLRDLRITNVRTQPFSRGNPHFEYCVCTFVPCEYLIDYHSSRCCTYMYCASHVRLH